MKPQHVLRVDRLPPAFTEIVGGLAEHGLHCGWLQWGYAPAPPPPLEEAAELGMLRGVAVGSGRTLALKALKGDAVLADLRREHFRGCALVLVHGEVEAPLLAPTADGWRVGDSPEAAAYSTEELVARLRSPLPFT